MKKIANKKCERKYGKKGACSPLKTYAGGSKNAKISLSIPGSPCGP